MTIWRSSSLTPESVEAAVTLGSGSIPELPLVQLMYLPMPHGSVFWHTQSTADKNLRHRHFK